MREHHVGDVIVVDDGVNGRRVPVDIVTDRDLVIQVLAQRVSADALTAGDLMSRELTELARVSPRQQAMEHDRLLPTAR